jgi:MerR family redox-sensitive transcriptional activator SoxR
VWASRWPRLPLRSTPCPRTAPDREEWARLSGTWRAGLDERIAQLKKLRDTLDDCIGCGCLSIDRCRLRNPFDKLASQGPGARRLLIKRAVE